MRLPEVLNSLFTYISKSDMTSPSEYKYVTTTFLAQYLEGSDDTSRILNVRDQQQIQRLLEHTQRLYFDRSEWFTFTQAFCQDPEKAEKRRLQRLIVQLLLQSDLFPKSFLVDVEVNVEADNSKADLPMTQYTYAYYDISHGQKVYVKRLVCLEPVFFKYNCEANIRRYTDLAHLLLRWRRMKHANLVDIIGISVNRVPGALCIVLPRIEHGSIMEYLRRCSANKDQQKKVYPTDGQQRKKWLHQAAEGLNYLHEQDFIHGNICGDNIMLGPNGEAQITDPGLHFLSELFFGHPSRHRLWAPERSTENHEELTKKVDVYSFGMTCYQIYAEKQPLAEVQHDSVACNRMYLRGKRPGRPLIPNDPTTMDVELFSLVEKCWATEPEDRPDMSYVLGHEAWKEV